MANPVRKKMPKASAPLIAKVSNGAKKISLVLLTFSFLLLGDGDLFAKDQALKKVEALMLQGAYSQAAGECRQILSRHRRGEITPFDQYLLGICLLKEANYEQARENFATILRKFPRSKYYDDAAIGIADSYFLPGEFAKAGARYEQFLQEFPRSQLASIARSQLKLCQEGRRFSNSYFSVQTGCFSSSQNAQRQRDELIDLGFQAYILELATQDLYRVRIGKFNTRLEAEILEQRLETAGFSTKICP